MSARKTILIVDDDPGTLHVLQSGLTSVLDFADVVTADNGREALEILDNGSIDVLVTDLAMPVLDGFSLIAAVNNRFSWVPVIVLSGMTLRDFDTRLARYRGLTMLHKPANYQDVAAAVADALERVELGQVEGIPLTAVLQLVESERRSCLMLITSGRRKGRLYFTSGKLVNAFSDDFGVEGEAAAHDILAWEDSTIEFGHLPEDVRRTIYTPMQLMLIDVAVQQDHDHAHAQRVAGLPVRVAASPEATASGRDDPDRRASMIRATSRSADLEEEGVMSIDDDLPTDSDRPEAAVAASHDAAAALAAPSRPAVPEPGVTAPQALELHAAELLQAMARLARRVQAADEALAAVGEDVASFREAQRLFDDVAAARERRRLELETFREEVSRLAREILERVEHLFDGHPPTLSAAEPDRVAEGKGE